MFFPYVTLSLLAFITALKAQTPEEMKSIPPCIMNCVVTAAYQSGCPLHALYSLQFLAVTHTAVGMLTTRPAYVDLQITRLHR